MALKLIPEEPIAPNERKKMQKPGQMKPVAKVPLKKSSLHQKLRTAKFDMDNKIILDASRELKEAVTKGAKYTFEKLNDLTHLLQRAILSVQRKKHHAVQKTFKKKK